MLALTGEDSQAARKLADASSSSPIQRTVTSIDAVDVTQIVELRGAGPPRCDQVVSAFGGAASGEKPPVAAPRATAGGSRQASAADAGSAAGAGSSSLPRSPTRSRLLP